MGLTGAGFTLAFGAPAPYIKVMADNLPDRNAGKAEIDAFLKKAGDVAERLREGPKGRLIFALDATASRQPTWDMASHLQRNMFEATRDIGGLGLQVCFFRGFGEFRASPWSAAADDIGRRMTTVTCMAGRTQIAKVLRHALNEAAEARVDALIYVGDMVEENPKVLAELAGEMGLRGLKAFLFHEGGDRASAQIFRQIADLSGGAYCPFDAGSAGRLKALLTAVAVYAGGGRKALLRLAGDGIGDDDGARLLLAAIDRHGARP